MDQLKITKAIALLAVIIVSLTSCKEDEMPEEYMRSGNSIALTEDGNLIIGGYNTGTSSGYDAYLVKVNSSTGDTIWGRSYGGAYVDAFFCVQKANKGGYIATGFSNRASGASPGMLVVITDNNGNQVKSSIYGGSNISQGFYVLPHANADSGYLVAGYIQKSGRADRDIYLVRINNDGSVKWEKSYGPAGNDSNDTTYDAAYSIAAAPDGGYYLTGSLKGYSSGGGKIFLMKVTANGDSLGTTTYGYGIGYSVIATKDGNLAVGGTAQETSNNEIFILKANPERTQLWKKNIYPLSGYEYGATLVQTSNDGFAITGITNSKGFGNEDVYLLLADKEGAYVDDFYFGDSNVDQGFGLVQNSSGDFFLSGLTNSGGSFIFLNKVADDGKQIWFKNLK